MSSNNLSSITVTAPEKTMHFLSEQTRYNIDGGRPNQVDVFHRVKVPANLSSHDTALWKIFAHTDIHPADPEQFSDDIAKECVSSLGKGNNPCAFTYKYQTEDGFDKTDVEVELDQLP